MITIPGYCQPGYHKVNGVCTACAAGRYSAGKTCVKCAGNSFSRTGAATCILCTTTGSKCYNPIANAAKTACVPSVFPAYVRATTWSQGHYLLSTSLPCVPVQKGTSKVGAWVVLQSVRTKLFGITIDSNAIIRASLKLAGVLPVETTDGNPVTHYRPSLHDLAVRFPAPYSTVKSRAIRVTGNYRITGSTRFACFETVAMKTCK